MSTFFFLFLALSLAPFVYHIARHGFSTPLQFFTTDGSMIQLRFIPAMLFAVWIAFNIAVFILWLSIKPGINISSVDGFHSVLYAPCFYMISMF